jgi:hypothetical protein
MEAGTIIKVPAIGYPVYAPEIYLIHPDDFEKVKRKLPENCEFWEYPRKMNETAPSES